MQSLFPCLWGSCPPKNWRNVSSPNGNAVCPREIVCVVNTVTTLGATFSTIGANVVISPCCVGLGSCAAAGNAPRCTYTIVPINDSTRRRKISLCIKHLSFKRESRAQPHPALFAKNAFRFSNSEKAQLRFEKTRGHSSQQFREAHRRLERVVLNTLAEQMPLCRLIFGPVQCYENFILRLRRLASSSEMPIHLSRGQRARLQPTKDH